MSEIRQLLGLQDGGALTCSKVRPLAAAHLEEIRRKIRDLQAMRKMLDGLGRWRKAFGSHVVQGTVPANAAFLPPTINDPLSTRAERAGRQHC